MRDLVPAGRPRRPGPHPRRELSTTVEIHDAIERADREGFTKEPPKTLKGQIGFLLKQLGSAKAVAQEIGVTADSVNRYRRGARRHARADVAAKIDDAVRARWQPLVRKRRQRQAATTGGITVETRARFGYTAPVGTTDDGRFRRLTVHLPPEYAQRLFDARDAGASDQQMRGIIAEGFKEVYFQDGGGRAMGLSDVEINDIDYLDLDY
jgi:DNA-binding transcriptional regulator YdaS (Cro superfamily)